MTAHQELAMEASEIRRGLLDLEARAEALAAKARDRSVRKVTLALVATRRTLDRVVDGELLELRGRREVRCG